jgi:hypothetical protein
MDDLIKHANWLENLSFQEFDDQPTGCELRCQKIAAALRAYTEREKELVEALSPFVSSYADQLAAFEELRRQDETSLPLGMEKADALCSFALNLTWDDLRRARAILEKHAVGKSANTVNPT